MAQAGEPRVCPKRKSSVKRASQGSPLHLLVPESGLFVAMFSIFTTASGCRQLPRCEVKG